MTEAHRLLRDIEAYCSAHEMAETTFGRLAVNDGKLVGRLRAGKSITLKTLDDITRFLLAPRPSAEAGADGSCDGPKASGAAA